MKKLALTLCLAALSTGAFAQGLVNFLNNTTTLASQEGVATAGAIPGWYFGLFIAPQNTTDRALFTYTGLVGTNQATAGRFSGGANVGVPGWAAGQTRAFYIAGWSASLGKTYDPVWMQGLTTGGASGFFGFTPIAPAGVAGGFDGTATLPSLNLFGGAQGITAGLNMTVIPVPEPSSFALAGLGAAAMLIFRRRK